MSTVKASELFAPASQRRKVRKCKDCTLLNPGSENHTDPDYCPSCVGKYLTQCRGCRAQFRRDGVNKLCRSCRGQIALFVVSS